MKPSIKAEHEYYDYDDIIVTLEHCADHVPTKAYSVGTQCSTLTASVQFVNNNNITNSLRQ